MPQDGKGDARRFSRSSYMLTAELLEDDGTVSAKIRVRDISAKGLRAEHVKAMMPDAPVRIRCRNVILSGKIAWSRDGWFGVTFDEEVDPAFALRSVVAEPGSHMDPFIRDLEHQKARSPHRRPGLRVT